MFGRTLLNDGFFIFLNNGFLISFFFLSYFEPITRESETMQHFMILSCCYGNNQDFIFSVVYVEGNNV